MSELLGALGGGAIGIAVGEGASTVLEPALEAPAQEAWKQSQAKVLELKELAELVATTINVLGDVEDDAHRNGYDNDALRSAVQLALKAPGVPEAEKLYLRAQGNYPGAITLPQLHHAYGKAGIEGQWWEPMTAAALTTLLSPAQIALGIIRSLIPDPGLMPVTLDVAGGVVPAYPASTINALTEAAAAGIDKDRLRVLVGTIGLPPSVGELANMVYRGIVGLPDYNRGLLEGDARPEWSKVWLEVFRQIPSPVQYLENHLRGYTTELATAIANAGKHGMVEADALIVYQNLGRPSSLLTITKGLAHGATFNPEAGELTDPYEASVRESNRKPGYYDLEIAASKNKWPEYFMLKEVVPDPITAEQASLYLQYEGYTKEVSDAVANALAAGGSKPKTETATDLAEQYQAGTLTPGDYLAGLEALGLTPDAAASKKAAIDARPLVQARTSLLSKLKSGVVGGAISAAQATTELAKTTVDPSVIPQLVATWVHENAIEQLTKGAAPA